MAFNIRQLLLFIGVFAAGLVALAKSDKTYVVDTVRISVIAVLVFSAYGIWISDRAKRAFRVGFLTWAGLYFVFHCVVSVEAVNLGTARLLHPLLTFIHPDVYVRDSQGVIISVHGTIARQYLFVGQCLLTLLFGLIGGWVTAYFYRKRQRMRDQT